MVGQIKVLLAACIVFMAGCVSIPTEHPTQDIQRQELEGHVRFMAQPGLKGRKAGSWENSAVRDYLSDRFRQYGLIPWADCKDYEQKFFFWTNMVGVLPGSDPNLADQMILVSAHYDHVGKEKGKIYPGACDNASGVAALLEIAEHLSLNENRPRRPVCFAAFDAEEMGCLGSFAFTCRDDYDDAKIAAVVNMDLLGRNLLDAVHNSLLVIGAEQYPDLERQITEFGRKSDLKVLPFGDSLVSTVSDHAAFISGRRPVLFFTCGIYRDYHEPNDTPDKIDFEKLQKETAVVNQTVRFLSDADAVKKTDAAVPNSLQNPSLSYVLQQVQANQRVFNLDPNSTGKLNVLIDKARVDLESDLSPAKQAALQRKTIAAFFDLIKDYNSQIAQFNHSAFMMSAIFSMYPETLSESFRQIIGHYLEEGLPLFSRPYMYRQDLPLTERDWHMSQIRDNQYAFAAITMNIEVRTDFGIVGRRNLFINFPGNGGFFKGSLDELNEYILLKAFDCSPHYVIDQLHITGFEAISKPDKEGLEISNYNAQDWLDIQMQFRRQYPQASINPPLSRDRLLALTKSSNVYIARTAITTYYRLFKDEIGQNLRGMLTDRTLDADVRQAVLDVLAKTDSRVNLLAITDVLDDQAPCRVRSEIILDNEFPLKDHPMIAELLVNEVFLRELSDNKKNLGKLGQAAAKHLKDKTKKKFGSDKQAWQEWIKKHYKE